MVDVSSSRFACLPIDDDGDTNRRIKLKKLKPKEETKPSSGNKKPDQKNKPTEKKKSNQPSTSSKPKSKSKTDNSKKKTQEQWETWKKRDAEFVDGHYENDLQEAMHLSMVDYEEKKELYDELKKQADEDKKAGKKKKSNKPQAMSLGEFNLAMGNKDQNQVDSRLNGSGDNSGVNGDNDFDPEYFTRVEKEAKKVLQAEKAEEKRKARQPVTDEMISIAQYQDQLDRFKQEITRLKEENESLKGDLFNVRTRNKKLCQLLSQGEKEDLSEEELLEKGFLNMHKLEEANKILLEKVAGVASRNKQLCRILWSKSRTHETYTQSMEVEAEGRGKVEQRERTHGLSVMSRCMTTAAEAEGRVKDKAEVLVEVDKLQKVRDELSAEVSSLAGQLEQEKSKVRALTAQLDTKANTKKKRTESK